MCTTDTTARECAAHLAVVGVGPLHGHGAHVVEELAAQRQVLFSVNMIYRCRSSALVDQPTRSTHRVERDSLEGGEGLGGVRERGRRRLEVAELVAGLVVPLPRRLEAVEGGVAHLRQRLGVGHVHTHGLPVLRDGRQELGLICLSWVVGGLVRPERAAMDWYCLSHADHHTYTHPPIPTWLLKSTKRRYSSSSSTSPTSDRPSSSASQTSATVRVPSRSALYWTTPCVLVG